MSQAETCQILILLVVTKSTDVNWSHHGVTTRYLDQQESKSRQLLCQVQLTENTEETIERITSALIKSKNQTANEKKQNRRDARERQHDIRSKDLSSRQLWLINYGERTITCTLALGFLSLVLPVMVGHTTAVGRTVVQPWVSLQRQVSP